MKEFIKSTSITKWSAGARQFQKRVAYKHYLRFKKLYFADSQPKTALENILSRRRSFRQFTNKALTRSDLGKLLALGCGKTFIDKKFGDYLRSYPSAGARYPLETYLVSLKKGNGAPKGIYHYNILGNCLERIQEGVDVKQVDGLFKQDFIQQAAALIVLTARPDRTLEKYGARGTRYIFLEGGHMAQNIYLIATERRIKCCAIGAFLDKELGNLLFLGANEFPIYVLAVGR